MVRSLAGVSAATYRILFLERKVLSYCYPILVQLVIHGFYLSLGLTVYNIV